MSIAGNTMTAGIKAPGRQFSAAKDRAATPGITLYRAPRFLGMTGKAPDAPCKRCRAGPIPAFSTGMSRKGQRPAFGRR